MPSPSSVTWTSTRGRGPAPTSTRPPNTVSSDRRVVSVSRPPAGHGLDPVLDQVLEHLDEPVRVGPERRETRVVAAHELDLVGPGRGLAEEGHAIEQLVEVHAPEGEGQRPPEIQEGFHHAVDAVDLGEHDAHVLPEWARAPELVPQELGDAPDRPERIPDLVREGERHLPQRREPLAAPDLRLEGSDPRQIAQRRRPRREGRRSGRGWAPSARSPGSSARRSS